MTDEETSPTPPPDHWKYANYFQVAVTGQEVVIDFALHFEGTHVPRWHTRIVLSASAGYELARLLEKSLILPGDDSIH
jgi:hypothetical protein